MNLGGAGDLSDTLQHLILPAFTLALLPGVLIAQAIAREITLEQPRSSARVWLTRLFKMMGLLLRQIGGWERDLQRCRSRRTGSFCDCDRP